MRHNGGKHRCALLSRNQIQHCTVQRLDIISVFFYRIYIYNKVLVFFINISVLDAAVSTLFIRIAESF